MMAYILERLQDYSPDWAAGLLASVPQEYHLVAKVLNDAFAYVAGASSYH
jgi:hypothetical protein